MHKARRQVLPAHGGRLVKSLGDGMLLLFDTVGQAVMAVLAIQHKLDEGNRAQSPFAVVVLRFGLHAGDVTEDDG